MHHLPLAALAMVKDGFFNVARRNTDFLAPLYIGDRAFLNSIRHRTFDVVSVTAQEPFTVHCALVLTVQSPVDYVGHSHGVTPAQ